MKEIITAIGNPIINEKLKENKNYIIQAPDIQYEEDLLEILKNKKSIEILILNIEIIKKDTLNNYIKLIKKLNKFIKIIILLEKENEEIKNILLANGIKDIFYGNKIKMDKLEEAINRNKTTEEILTEEINNLKEIILNKKINNKNKLLKFPKIKNNLFNEKNNKNINNYKKIENKIISIIGSSGVGKSIFTANLAMSFENKKILVIDFDILNKSLKTLFRSKGKSSRNGKRRRNIRKNNN